MIVFFSMILFTWIWHIFYIRNPKRVSPFIGMFQQFFHIFLKSELHTQCYWANNRINSWLYETILPSVPLNPGFPSLPASPSRPGIPSRPFLPGIPSNPGSPGTPSLPSSPATPSDEIKFKVRVAQIYYFNSRPICAQYHCYFSECSFATGQQQHNSLRTETANLSYMFSSSIRLLNWYFDPHTLTSDHEIQPTEEILKNSGVNT